MGTGAGNHRRFIRDYTEYRTDYRLYSGHSFRVDFRITMDTTRQFPDGFGGYRGYLLIQQMENILIVPRGDGNALLFFGLRIFGAY